MATDSPDNFLPSLESLVCAYQSKSQSMPQNLSWAVVQDSAPENILQCFLKAPVEHRRPAARHSPHVLWARLQAECSLPLAHLSTTPSTAGTCSCGRQCHFTKAKSLTERADGSGGNSETGELKGQRLLLSWVAQGSAAKEAVSGWGEAWEGLKEPEACSTSRAATSRRPHLCFTNLSVKSLLGRLSCEMSRQSPIVTEVQEVPQIRPRYGARRTGTLPRSRAAGAAGEWGRAQAEGTGPHTPNASAACSHPATSSSSSGSWKHVSPYKGHGLCFLAVLKLCGKWHMQKWHAEKKFKIHCLGAKVPAGASYINVTALTPEGHTASTSALNFFPWNLIFLQKLFFFFFSLVWWKYLLVSHSPFKYADHVMNLICILIILSQGINCLPTAITPPNFCRAVLGLWLQASSASQAYHFWILDFLALTFPCS